MRRPKRNGAKLRIYFIAILNIYSIYRFRYIGLPKAYASQDMLVTRDAPDYQAFSILCIRPDTGFH
jgi:hypothetical protein